MSDIAVIGAGYWGSIIISNLRKITKKKIYIYDSSKQKLINIKKKIKNLIIVDNLDFLIKNKKIKFVFLIIPPSQTLKILLKLINNKKNVFVEKPFLNSLKDIDIIKNALNKNKTTLMVGYIYLYNQIIKKIKNIIKNKTLGKLLFIKCIRENLGPVRSDVDCNFDLASHDLSILKYLFNSELEIKKKIDHKILNKNISDSSTIQLTTMGIPIELRCSWLSTEKIRKIIFVGSKKMLLFDEMLKNNQLRIYNQYAKYPEINKMGNKILSKTARVYKGDITDLSYKKNDPLIDELKYFFKCSLLKRKPLTDINFAKSILNILIVNRG